MKTFKMFFSGALLLCASLFLFTACDDDDNNDNGNVRFEITDGPVDDPNVKGVIVTIVGVEVDGQPITDFEGPLTFNLMDYRNGEVKSLGFADLQAGTYSNVRLIMDYNRDENGNTPGVYVLTEDNVKHALTTSTARDSAITVAGNFTVDESDRSDNVVIDFDLRKAVNYSQSGSTTDYTLVSDAELDAVARVITKEDAGTIKGNFDGNLSQAGDMIVVYAYKKGTYTNTERQAQGTSGIFFKNAVTSAVVSDGGDFTLSYLQEGTYELYFVGYDDTNNDGRLEMRGSVLLDILGDINPNNVIVDPKVTTNLDLKITGLTPF